MKVIRIKMNKLMQLLDSSMNISIAIYSFNVGNRLWITLIKLKPNSKIS